MADMTTIAQFATAAGTLVLAAATFGAVRSANTAARTAERSLMTGLRPLLVQGRQGDPPVKVLWQDRHVVRLDGGRAYAAVDNGVIYVAMSVHNAGSGIALLHGWDPWPEGGFGSEPHHDPDRFRRLTIDLYIPAGDSGYWQGAIRDPDDPCRPGLEGSIVGREPVRIDVLYSDQEGGQRTISRFTILPGGGDSWYAQASRHWNLDRPDPR
jgi:hypothetical protein